MANLDSFVQSSRPQPQPVSVSQEVRDRGSTFVANIYRANTPEQAARAVSYLKNVVHSKKRATHEISAWRSMVLKPGKSGLGGPDDFEVKEGNDDDGEKYGSGKILKVMQAEGVIDAVVIVSRWYGGELLGPVRFNHIEVCTREVCQKFRQIEEMEETITTLLSLDDILASLRAEVSDLAAVVEGSSSQASVTSSLKSTDYSALRESLDLVKGKRLIKARENSIKVVKATVKKAKEMQSQTTNPLSTM